VIGDTPRKRVLHVMLRAGAGQVSAAQNYVLSTPEFDHHLLLATDPTCHLGPEFEALAASVTEMPAGWPARVRAVRVTAERLQPDAIHAHSSFGGGLARSVLPRRWRRRVVYTPHCYSFFRQDIGPVARAGFRMAELVLAHRGPVVAACSPHEERAARRLSGRQFVVTVPNIVADYTPGPLAPPPVSGEPLRIVTVGRVSPQKLPALFAEAARASRDRGLQSTWTWIGGGDPAGEAELAAAGVEVTGWVDRRRGLQLLEQAHVYVHTAAWESAPMTVLEAAVADVPVLARRIPSLDALGVAPLWDSVDELLTMLQDYPGGPAFVRARASHASLRQRHTRAGQRAALLAAYEAVMSAPSRQR
jgi:glycosyltransferase involved in cell wall biosynthesis